MVGIPGRSSGCHTCRARHIKCDERKPMCLRCEKSGYACQGYEKPIHFLIHTPTGQSPSSASSWSSSSPPSPFEFSPEPSAAVPAATTSALVSAARHPQPPVFPPSHGPPIVRPRLPGISKVSGRLKHHDGVQQRAPAHRNLRFAYYNPPLPRELHFGAFTYDIASTYTFSNLVYSSFGRPWLQLAAQGYIDETALSACKALALGLYGNSQRQKSLQNKAASEYGISLRLLIEQISKADQANAGRYVIPVMVMLMYNFSVAKNSDFSHHDGLRQLVLFCGPQRFQEQPLLVAFEATRDLLISRALLDRKRIFLEENMWRTVPWALNPAAKSPSNHLLDILCEVPGFLEDEAIITSTGDSALRVNLLHRVEKCLQDVYHWRWKWEADNPNAVVEVATKPPGDLDLSHIPPGLETSLHYQKWIQANEICLYNAVLLWLLRFLRELRPVHFPYPSPSPSPRHSSTEHSPEPPESSCKRPSPSDEYAYLQNNILAKMPHTPLLLPGQARNLRQAAMEICRSFGYLIKTFSKTTDTALAWLMPISLAYYVVQEDPDYARWIRKQLDEFEDIWVVLQNTNPDSVYWVDRCSDRYDAFPSQFGTAFLQEFRERGVQLPVRPQADSP